MSPTKYKFKLQVFHGYFPKTSRITGCTKKFLFAPIRLDQKIGPGVSGLILGSGFGNWFKTLGIPGFVSVLVFKDFPLPGFVLVPDDPVSFVPYH